MTLANLKAAMGITAADVGAAPATRTIATGTGLSGGGDLSADRTLTLADTAVTPGSYGNSSAAPVVTVDAQGRITAASNSNITPASIGAATSAQGAKADSAVQPALLGITRAQIASMTITFPAFYVSGSTVSGDAGAGALYIEGTSAGPRAIQDAAGTWFELSCGGVADLGHFGAPLNGTDPDDDALDAAYSYLMNLPNGGKIVFPEGTCRFDVEHNVHPYKSLEFDFEVGSKVYCGISGADKVMWKATHPDGETRGQAFVISGRSDVWFHPSVSGVGAVFFEYLNASDLKIYGSGHNWIHYKGNTAWRTSGEWNCDREGVTFWGAGVRKSRKSTGTATFSISNGSTTLTASAAVFDAGDVGDIIVVGSASAEKFVIASVGTSTQATVERAATQDIVAERASFGSVRCTTTAGGATVTLESACLDASDVGRVVYIPGARTMWGGGSPKRLHRATITSVTDSTHMVVAPAPELAVTLGVIIFSPGVEIFADEDTGNAVNDIVWRDLHLEHFVGTGLVVRGGANAFFPQIKLHGYNGGANETASDHLAWFDQIEAWVDGNLEGLSTGRMGRIAVSGLVGTLAIGPVIGVGVRRQPLLTAVDISSTGTVEIGRWDLLNATDSTSLAEAFRLVGSGRIHQTGRVSSLSVLPSTYPEVSGPRPPAGLLPSTTETVWSLSGAVRCGLLSAGAPTHFGATVGGTVEAPTGTADYATAMVYAGMALAPTGTALVDIAQIKMVARSPSGANVAGQLEFATRYSGTLATRWTIDTAGGMLPAADNAYDIGWASGRVKEIFCANATINTSDAREKQDIGAIPDAWLDAWGDVQWQRFRWIDAVAEKGEAARWHVGLIAQEIDAAFKARGLDASAIGLLCYDEWAEESFAPAVLDGDGNESVPAREGRPAGSRWGVRYSECAALEAAWMRREIKRMSAALSKD